MQLNLTFIFLHSQKVGGEFKTLKMYAIVDIAGQQFKVEKEQKIFVHRLEAEQGQKIEFDKVLLIDNDGKINVGAPTVEGAMVTAEVVSHLKGDKVKVFKKKRRKGYKKFNGHRQYLSEIIIEDILEKGKKAKAASAKAEAKTEEPVVETTQEEKTED